MFMRMIFEALGAISKRHHHIWLNNAFHLDLQWWNTFFCCMKWSLDDPGVAYTRAPQLRFSQMLQKGLDVEPCGAHNGCSWSGHEPWHLVNFPSPEGRSSSSILACAKLGRQWSRHHVMVHCDIRAAVSILNSGYSHDSQIMHLLHCLFIIKTHLDIELRSVHCNTRGRKYNWCNLMWQLICLVHSGSKCRPPS